MHLVATTTAAGAVALLLWEYAPSVGSGTVGTILDYAIPLAGAALVGFAVHLI